MGPTGDRFRVLQVHPTRFCNLTCAHCYSSSGPREREELSASLLMNALSDARDEGYNDVGFSGGEPVLYRELRPLLSHAKSLGLLTSVTSNGVLLDARRLDMLTGVTDLLAISLDGMPATHNRMRGSPHAFDLMASRLEGVRGTRIPFGFIFTLTLHNLNELDWVARFALDQGASLLQIHPLEEVGRARLVLAGRRPDELEAACAFVEASRLQAELGDRLAIRLDLMDRELLRPTPDRVYAGPADLHDVERPLADLLTPLVIEQDGAIVPLVYGFSRRFMVGNLHAERLRDAARRWKTSTLPDFQNLCRQVFVDETETTDLPIFNWYEAIERAGHGRARIESVACP